MYDVHFDEKALQSLEKLEKKARKEFLKKLLQPKKIPSVILID